MSSPFSKTRAGHLMSFDTMRRLQTAKHFIVIAAVLAIAFIAGPACSAPIPTDSRLFTEGFAAFQNNNYRESVGYLSRLLELYPESPLRDMTLLLLARADFRVENRQDAARYMIHFLNEFPDSPLTTKGDAALLALATRFGKGETHPGGSGAASLPSEAMGQQGSAEPPEKGTARRKLVAVISADDAARKERLTAEKAERERIAAQKAEEERIARERRAAGKAAAEKAGQERLARAKAEEERLAKEKAERERLAKEEAAKLAAEKAERERIAARKAEEERIARERLAAEKAAAEKAEQERLVRAKAEEERLAKEKAERERLAKDEAAKLAAEKAERERIAAWKAEEERIARERLAAEKAAAEKAEQERLARAKAEEERLAKEKAERERLAKEAAAKLAAEKAEQERIAARKAEEERSRVNADEAGRGRIVAALVPLLPPPLPATPLPEPHASKVEPRRIAAVDLRLTPPAHSCEVGREISIPFEIANRGTISDRYSLTSDFPAAFQPRFASRGRPGDTISETPELLPRSRFEGVFDLTLPATSIDDQRFTHRVLVCSRTAPQTCSARDVQLTAAAPFLRAVVRPSAEKVRAGGAFTIAVTLLNAGSTPARDLSVRLSYDPSLVPAATQTSMMHPVAGHALGCEGLRVGSGELREIIVPFKVGSDATVGRRPTFRIEVENKNLGTREPAITGSIEISPP